MGDDGEDRREPLHINALPVELLAKVFLQVVEAFGDDIAEWQPPSKADPAAAHHHHKARIHPAVTVSHVCQQWRTVSLLTSPLWAHLIHTGTSWNLKYRRAFLHRSSSAPLQLRCQISSTPTTEISSIKRLFRDLSGYYPRLLSLALQCNDPEPFVSILDRLTDLSLLFFLDRLQSLELSIAGKTPTFRLARSLLSKSSSQPFPPQTPSLNGNDVTADSTAQQHQHDLVPSSNLKHLKVGQLPLRSIPAAFLPKLTTLWISFPPRETVLTPYGERDAYQLRMSELCDFLRLTPALEELTLFDAIPVFDVFTQGDERHVSSDLKARVLPKVRLPRLKAFEWGHPWAREVHFFLTFFELPCLERLDLWIERVPARRKTEFHLVDIQMLAAIEQTSERRGAEVMPKLRDVSIQCPDGESAKRVMRDFVVERLERLELTGTEWKSRMGKGPFPEMPRLDAVFRDPRQRHLTHLTLSHFHVPDEVCALLGYLPSLAALWIDTCTGVPKLLAALRELGGAGGVQHKEVCKPRKAIKFCPRLEALTLWECGEVKVEDVEGVVRARLWRSDAEDGGEQGCAVVLDLDEDKQVTTTTATTMTTTMMSGDNGRLDGRQTKPLGRRRRGEGRWFPGPEICTSCPSPIVYVRLERCQAIPFEDAQSLKELGVLELLYN